MRGKQKVKQIRNVDVELNLKDNTFVKIVPTHKMHHLIENTEEMVKVIVLSKSDPVVQYADYMKIEEEILCVALPDHENTSVLRVSTTLIWEKSTIMKGMIQTNFMKESKKSWELYKEYIKKNGHAL